TSAEPRPDASSKAPARKEFSRFGGKHHETAGLANVLAHIGVASPHTGPPYSEEMLLRVGGGVGTRDLLFAMCGDTLLQIGSRHHWQSTKAEFLQGIGGRLGLRMTTKEAGGRKAATENLHEALDSGRPAFVWVGQAGLPWHALPIEWLKGFVYCVVVYGFDAKTGRYRIADRCGRPCSIGADALMTARLAIDSLRGRTLIVDPPAKPPDLRKAVRDGILACLQGMT